MAVGWLRVRRRIGCGGSTGRRCGGGLDAQVEGAVKRTEPGVGCVSMRWLDRMEGELGRARLGQFERLVVRLDAQFGCWEVRAASQDAPVRWVERKRWEIGCASKGSKLNEWNDLIG